MKQVETKPAIPPSVMVDVLPPVADGYKPTTAEIQLLRVLMDVEFVSTNPKVPDICKRAGIGSLQTYYSAIKKPGFVKTLQMYAVDPCKGRMPKYIEWLEKFAEQGSWPHLKALLAMTGVYQEGYIVEIEQVRTVTKPVMLSSGKPEDVVIEVKEREQG